MAYRNNNDGPRISYDKFNQPYQLHRSYAKTGKDGNTYESSIFTLNGKEYKVEISDCTKDTTKDTQGRYWIKVTGLKKQDRPKSM